MLINTENQSNEKLSEVYYRILNQGMVVEGEGREYIKDEIMADSEMPLIFKMILCGDFENIPWGDKTLDDEKDIYYEEYQSYLKYYKVFYDDDERSKITHNGIYYFIDGEMVLREDVEAWLEEKVWQQMIPTEEWGIVP